MKRLKELALAAGIASTCLALPAFAADSSIPNDLENPGEEPTVQASDFYSAFDPQTRQIITRLVTKEGKSLTLVVDQAINAVYLSDSTGATASISIPELAEAYSQGNSEKYADFIATMQRNLNAKTVLEIIAKQQGYALDPPNGIAHPCDMQPCGVLQRRFIDGHLESVYRWSLENVDYSYRHFYTPEEIAEDEGDFERWQSEQCDTSNSEFIEAFLGYLTAIGTCSLSETGLGALACGASLGAGIKDHNDSRTAERNCRMRYSGPRSWAR